MASSGSNKEGRLKDLYENAMKRKYTHKGKFHYDELLADAMAIGVGAKTAHEYSDSVIARLKKNGHVRG